MASTSAVTPERSGADPVLVLGTVVAVLQVAVLDEGLAAR